MTNKFSYRQAFKATSIFGGVQAIKLVIGFVRSKFVAVLLGPAGTGFSSLLGSPLSLIGNFTGLGISYSAIKDLSEAYAEGNSEAFARTLITFRRWIWFTGLLGMFVTLILAPFLSYSSFGNYDYTWAFLILSATFVINSISSGQSSVLYATRRIKDTSRSSIIGSLLGVLTAIPLYYFYGIKGIVPALLIGSFTSLILTWYFARRIKIEKVKISFKDSFWSGLSFAKVGFAMMLSGIMGTAVIYLINAFISHVGGLDQVGLYHSGWSITDQFVGLVFTAMAADYYPRLAGVNRDNDKILHTVNEQAEIGLLIIGPIMLAYLLFLPLIIPLLLSDKYLLILDFAQWVVIGMLLKVVGWSLGYIALAKGKSVLYFKLELIGTVIQVVSILGGYYFLGLEGVGIAFVILYVSYVVYMYVYYRNVIDFRFSHNTVRVFLVLESLCVISFLAVKFLPTYLGYSVNFCMLILSAFYSVRILKMRLGIDIRNIIKNKIIRKFSPMTVKSQNLETENS